MNAAATALATGPRTEEGKQRSSQNSLKHGLFAKTIVLSGESQQEFDALREGLIKEYAPDEPSECEMVNTLAETQWRLVRLRRLEAAAMEQALETGDLECKFLLNWSLYEQRLNRLFQSTLKTLQQTQVPRREQAVQRLNSALQLRMYFEHKNIPWNPADDGYEGFVFSTDNLDRMIAGRRNLDLAQQYINNKSSISITRADVLQRGNGSAKTTKAA